MTINFPYFVSLKFRYGRAEQTKRDLDVLDKRMKEKELMAFMEEFTGVDQAERERRTYIKKNQFEKLRKLPTMREQRESLHKWYSGVHYPYDIDKGFPIRSVINLSGKRASHDVMRDPDVYNKEKIYSSKRFLKGRESAETGYRQHMTNVNLKEAVKFLKSNQKIIDADILKNQTEKSFNMKNRRRAAQATADLATDAVLARVALFQKEHKFTKSLNKFDEFGMEITGKEYESSSSSASSSSSSSKDSNGQEVEDTIKKLDPNIAEVLQNSRGHAGIRNSSTFNRKSFFGNLQQPGNLFSLDKSATVAPKSESEDNQSVDSEKDLKRFFDSRGTKPGDRKHRRRRRGASAISHRLLVRYS